MKTVGGREYPVPRSSDEFAEFKETREYAIHGIYEQMMLEIDTPTALGAVNDIHAKAPPKDRCRTATRRRSKPCG